MAHVAADVDGEVAADGARGGGKGVGGTEQDTAGLDGVTALPDHGADGARGHVWGALACNATWVVERGGFAGALQGSWRGCGDSEARARTGNQAGEEGLASEVGVVLLEVLLAGLDELDGSELEAAVLEARDDGANEATLGAGLVCCVAADLHRSAAIEMCAAIAANRGGVRTWTPSGLIAMKLFPTVSYTAFQVVAPRQGAIGERRTSAR